MIKNAIKVGKTLKIFPCNPATKAPFINEWQNLASNDEEQINKWWKRFPNAMIGCPTGPTNGIWVLDTDMKVGDVLIDGERNLHDTHSDITGTRMSKTRGGGRHRFYLWEDESPVKNSASQIAEGVDTRGRGGYVILPPSKGYEWISKKPVVKASKSMMSWVPKVNEKKDVELVKPLHDSVPMTPEELDYHLDNLDVSEYRSRSAWLELMLSVKHACHGDEWGREMFLEWSKSDDYEFDKDPETELEKLWETTTAQKEGGITAGTLIHKSQEAEQSNLPCAKDFEVVKDTTGIAPEQWDTDSKGKRTASPLNCFNFMTLHSTTEKNVETDDKGVAKVRKTLVPNPLFNLISLDEFTYRKTFMFEPPWNTGPKRIFTSLKDHDYVELKSYINRRWGVIFSTAMIRETFDAVAQRNLSHQVRDYLETLEWDGVKRLDTIFKDYLGCKGTKYEEVIGRKLIMAAVARAYTPGIAYPHMVILEGEQGTGKSTFLKILAGYKLDDSNAGWHNSFAFSDNNKDNISNTLGSWFVEYEELSKLGARDIDELKRFISSSVKTETLKYDKECSEFRDSYVLVGTINPLSDKGYLTDPTGGRRFYPIEVGKLDKKKVLERLVSLESNRDQIIAEAKSYVLGGESILVQPGTEGMDAVLEVAESVQESRREICPVEDEIIYLVNEGIFKDDTFIMCKDLFAEVQSGPAQGNIRQTQSSIKRVMTSLKWKIGVRKVRNRSQRGYIRRRPIQIGHGKVKVRTGISIDEMFG